MKKTSLTILVLCSILMLNSCVKEIPFNGDEYPPRLVINSLITPGDSLIAELGKTYFFLDQDDEIDTSIPDSLQVDLFVNGQHLSPMIHSSDSIEIEGYQIILRQYFTSDYTPVEGDVIKIVASAPGFESAEATTSAMPKKPLCSIVDITMLEHYEIEQNDEWESWPWFWLKNYAILSLEITDPEPGQTNYYYLPGAYDFDAYDEDFPDLSISIRANLNDPIFENYSSSTNETLFDFYPYKDSAFTDALFDGGSYRIQIPIDLIVYGISLSEAGLLQPKILLPVQQLTKEYYHYLCSVNYVMDQMQIFVEPPHTYSNVHGGYGIVGGINSSTVEYIVPVPDDTSK